MKAALDNGSNLWNGGEFYGPPNANSLQLLNHYFTKYPEDKDKVYLSMKGAFSFHPLGPNNSPENIRKSIDTCLDVLGNKVFIDNWEPARADPKIPIETTIETIAEYVKAGKIGGIGLSECSASTIRRAHAVHPITSVEVEFSIFTTDPYVDKHVAATLHQMLTRNPQTHQRDCINVC
jgi:pyridoxine 4-dehydrogenase